MSFPRCVNEYVDRELVEKAGSILPEDDVRYLTEKHERQCREALAEARKAVKSIETYAAMTQTPHLFTKQETDDLSEENMLSLIVKVITDMYDEEPLTPMEYIRNLAEKRQHLDNILLSLDYGD